MFKKYSICLEYFDNHIKIFILKYTGIRFEQINFNIIKIDNEYIVDKKYEKIFNDYHIFSLIKKNIKFKNVFENYNKDQKSLENFTKKNIKIE